MRTNIDIDDGLMAEAMRATGLKTKKAVVEEALRALAHERKLRDALAGLRGLGWDGDLDDMRSDRAGPARKRWTVR